MNSHLKIWEISCFCIDAFYCFFPFTVLAFLLKYFCISMLLKYLTEVQALKACNERRKKWQRELRILHKRAGLCRLAPWPYIWSFGFYGWLNRTICRVLWFLSFLLMILQQIHQMMDCSKHSCFLRIIDQLLDCSLV